MSFYRDKPRTLENCEAVGAALLRHNHELQQKLAEAEFMVRGLPLTDRTLMLHKLFKTDEYHEWLTQFTKES